MLNLDEVLEVVIESCLELVLAEEEPLAPRVGRVRNVEEAAKGRNKKIKGLNKQQENRALNSKMVNTNLRNEFVIN